MSTSYKIKNFVAIVGSSLAKKYFNKQEKFLFNWYAWTGLQIPVTNTTDLMNGAILFKKKPTYPINNSLADYLRDLIHLKMPVYYDDLLRFRAL
jgi:hypothetical protein